MKQKVPSSPLKKHNDGEKFKFDRIYRQHSHSVMKFLMGRLNNKCDAQDAAQEIWSKIPDLLCSFDESKASMLTWLLSIAANEVHDMMKSFGYKTGRLGDDWLDTHVADNPRYADDPAYHHIDINILLGFLKDRDREILELRFLLGYNQREIAKKLKITYAVVSRRINKAIAQIKESLSCENYEN
jgi:RNA polymerase sigma factor (sigma-70 family)